MSYGQNTAQISLLASLLGLESSRDLVIIANTIAGNVTTQVYNDEQSFVYQLQKVYFYLDTDANAADRFPRMSHLNESGYRLSYVNGTDPTQANEVSYTTFVPNGQLCENAAERMHLVPCDPITLQYGARVDFMVANGVAGDSYNIAPVFKRIRVPMVYET